MLQEERRPGRGRVQQIVVFPNRECGDLGE